MSPLGVGNSCSSMPWLRCCTVGALFASRSVKLRLTGDYAAITLPPAALSSGRLVYIRVIGLCKNLSIMAHNPQRMESIFEALLLRF